MGTIRYPPSPQGERSRVRKTNKKAIDNLHLLC
jgi:hypothetical protein